MEASESDRCELEPFLEALSLYLANFNVISPTAEGGHSAFSKRYAEILEKNGVAGQQFACGFFDDFKKNLGKAASDCLEGDFLRKHRASEWSPFPLILALEHFKCGEGAKAMDKNFDCLRKAHINHEKIAGHCITPDMKMERCSDWDRLIKCEREAFAKACGKEAGDHRAAELKIHENISGVDCRKDQ